MPFTRFLPLSALILLGGCVYGVHERADQIQCDLSLKPYDLAPPGQAEPPKPAPGPEKLPAPSPAPTDVQTTALMEGAQADKSDITEKGRLRFEIPPGVPGSETPRLDFSKMTDKERKLAFEKLYPPMPPLPQPPAALPGPGGKPYTLADLQQLAAQYSPTLKQAIYDVAAAQGNLYQARAYPNPTFAFEADPNVSTGLTPSFMGFSIDQPIKTSGKLKLQEAAARMDLLNAELALRRARSDLSTAVRNAYFGVLVARETVRVNRAVAVMTDEVYRVQVDLAEKLAATYEPSVLQAQALQARLAYEQSLRTYASAWSQLAAAVGLRERDLPLSELAGRLDAFVPVYDYEKVLAHVLTRHTDVLSARNTIQKGDYNLKLQRITPWFQDFDVQVKLQHEFAPPAGLTVPSVVIGTPLSVWDQNKGNIIAAEAALGRAHEESHRVEMNLTTTLATNFATYRNNLLALEQYRDRILPAQVRAYRGVFERRYLGGAEVKTPVAFADVVAAQQALIQSVTTYLGVLGSLWTSVVSVADLLQTDDLFQLARPEELHPIPDLEHLVPLPCGHECPAPAAPAGACRAPAPAPAPSPAVPVAQPPTLLPAQLPPPTDDGDDPFFPPAPAAAPGSGPVLTPGGTTSQPRPGGPGR
jgi:cobalt-zinc-cadmium efflux system outer membrane protein